MMPGEAERIRGRGPPGRRRLVVAAAAVAACAAALAIFEAWKAGSPYGGREASPNERYYVQKYTNWNPRRFLFAGPGQGSDGLSGYVRLFQRDGHLLEERYVAFSRDVRPLWSGNRVYLLGVPEMDDTPWILPESAE